MGLGGLDWFLCNLGALGALWSLTVTLERSPRRGLILGAGCALVATFSLGHGLLIWPVGLALLILQRRPWRTWAALSVATTVAYFAGWENVSAHPSKSLFLEHPVQFVDFMLLYLGRGLAVSTSTGRLVGGALLLGFLAGASYVVARRRDPGLVERSAFWLGTGVYVLGAAVLTAISRLGFGVEYAGVSRYTTMGALFAIATMALLFAIARSDEFASRPVTLPVRRAAMATIALMLLIAALANLRGASDATERWGDHLSAFAACTRQVQTSTDPCLNQGIPPPTSPIRMRRLFDVVMFLRSNGWAGY